MTSARDPQDNIFDFLADPATHRGATVKRIDTHAAAVFLVGDVAYKVKRAVRFPFLDFSTLDKRKAALAAEIEANKPFAPELYLALEPITGKGTALTIGGQSEVVEWALKMRRFDENQTLDHLASAGRISIALAETLARAVADAHARAPVVEAAPWIAALGDYIAQNDAAFAEHPHLFPRNVATALAHASHAALDTVRPLLAARGSAGLVRRGHGDLHLGNIALIEGRPVPFDALEFDPLIASGDVLYDLAFLLMDLVERRLDAAANHILNIYVGATRRDMDLDALAALPLFMSLRAAIRAKVTAAKIAHGNSSRRAAIEREAATYFALSCRLIAPPHPRLVAVGGLSGTGKSALARALAPELAPAPGALVLRSDVERKAMCRIAETAKLPPQAYAPDVTARVYATLIDKARRVLAAGHSAVIDAVFARQEERAAIETVAQAHGLRFCGLFLTADLATRVARVGAREADASDADAAVARRQESYDLSGLHWSTVDASGTPEHTLANAKAALE